MSEVQKLLMRQSRKAAGTLAQIDLAIEKLSEARAEVAELRRLVIQQLLENRGSDKSAQPEGGVVTSGSGGGTAA